MSNAGYDQHRVALHAPVVVCVIRSSPETSQTKRLNQNTSAVGAQLKAEDSEAAAGLQALLSSTADVYRTLLGNAKKAGIAVPAGALLEGAPRDGDRELLQWNDYAAVEAEDWHWEDFEDEGMRAPPLSEQDRGFLHCRRELNSVSLLITALGN